MAEQQIKETVDFDQGAPRLQLTPEQEARRNAALRQVRVFGDPVLRAKALLVDKFDGGLAAEAGRMSQLMRDAIGVGLAATQLGIMHRLFVYKVGEEGEFKSIVNPDIVWSSDEMDQGEEGCLSLPGVHIMVERPNKVHVKAQDTTGAEIEIEAEGLEARVIQHELDHLDGILIIDRAANEVRREAMRILRSGLV